MKFTAITAKVILVVLLATAVCVSAADSPTVTIKGYVLDSACAFTKGLSKPISKQCATSCAKCRVTARHSRGRWNYLLAHRRHHAI